MPDIQPHPDPKVPKLLLPAMGLLLFFSVLIWIEIQHGFAESERGIAQLAEHNASNKASPDASLRTIVRAIDGDTLVLDGAEKVRVLGIDTGELYEKTKAGGWRKIANPAPGAVASSEFAASLEGRKVRIVYGKKRRDRYGRSLAHIYVVENGDEKGFDLACEMLRRGWAKIMAIPPNTSRHGRWKTAKKAGAKR